MLVGENTNKGGWTEPQRPLRESSAGTSRAGTALMLVGENTNKVETVYVFGIHEAP
jgi:hypothetical protein